MGIPGNQYMELKMEHVYTNWLVVCVWWQVTTTWNYIWAGQTSTTQEDCPVPGWVAPPTSGVTFSSTIISGATRASCRCGWERTRASHRYGRRVMPLHGAGFTGHRSSPFRAQTSDTRYCTGPPLDFTPPPSLHPPLPPANLHPSPSTTSCWTGDHETFCNTFWCRWCCNMNTTVVLILSLSSSWQSPLLLIHYVLLTWSVQTFNINSLKIHGQNPNYKGLPAFRKTNSKRTC